MPIYTYRCNDCEDVFEMRQRMTDDPITECPACGGHVRRVVNSVGIVFKGSGFYVTDNRSSSNGNGRSQSSSTSSNGKSSSATSESKTSADAKSN
ncbi:MAG: hypothetical protein D6706_17235 [Chloroflexi bacterium]|nr:MAG: hypothetical protein D6706_17235 [Chloroflexota bacterium]